MKKHREFALYKGEDIIAMGTYAEIAETIGVQKKTVYYYASPAYRRRLKKLKNPRVLVDVSDDNEEDDLDYENRN